MSSISIPDSFGGEDMLKELVVMPVTLHQSVPLLQFAPRWKASRGTPTSHMEWMQLEPGFPEGFRTWNVIS